jgi:hypothetical protein
MTESRLFQIIDAVLIFILAMIITRHIRISRRILDHVARIEQTLNDHSVRIVRLEQK